MYAKYTFFCVCTLVVLIARGLANSEEHKDDVKKQMGRAHRDLQELVDSLRLMEDRIPKEVEALIKGVPSVIAMQETLETSGNKPCTEQFHRKVAEVTDYISTETLKSIGEQTNEFRGLLLRTLNQLRTGPAMSLKKRSDDLSRKEYSNILEGILKFVNKDLSYEEDSVKVMESSYVEYVRERLHKELEQRGTFDEVNSCMDASRGYL